ncbi:glycosyl transferase family 90-domain-containing protein [Mycena capillaripes]|nr:glycosyl transferase family 90-domain-containing protein [Mycena capillaripes]
MSSPVYAVLRRRSLRRPASILVVFCVVAFMARFMRDVVFDAQHSTRIAFKYAAGRAAANVTHTLWATYTVTRSPIPTEPAAHKPKIKPKPKVRAKEMPLGQHTYRPDGLLEVNPLGPHPIFELIERAEAVWAAKLARASTSLRQAVAEYTRRYRRPPPRGFDLWWAYAAAHDVPLPDEYDQIDRDLAPFYGVDPVELQETQRAWEAHMHSYTIGKDKWEDGLEMLNFTLPEEEGVRRELASGGFQIIELLREVEAELPPFRAVFSPHDSPNLVMDYELRQQALDAARKGTYIDSNHPPPAKHGWLAACPPLSPAHRAPPFDDSGVPKVQDRDLELEEEEEEVGPKTFIHASLPATSPCLHPSHLITHGAYLAHGAGPAPHRVLIPQFSYSVTPLHADVRVALPVNWVSDDMPNEGRPPPLGLSWAERVDVRLQWRGSNTGIWHAPDGRWRAAHRVRLAALGAGAGGENASVLDPGSGAPGDEYVLGFGGEGWVEEVSGQDERQPKDPRHTPVGTPHAVPRARLVPALLDVAFVGRPMNCAPEECKVLEGMFEWRREHDLRRAGRYKYVFDVDGNGWSSRFKRLMNSGSLIFKATGYPEWFTDRLAPWVHYVPIQNSYSDLFDALVFFRAHDAAGARIAAAGREWSRRYWRKEDLVSYMYRLFLEYARVMSTDRAGMAFEMWEDEREDAVHERALRARWKGKGNGDSQEAD